MNSVRIIQFGTDNYLVVDADDKPQFEITFHSDVSEMVFTEVCEIVKACLARKKSEERNA